MEVEVGAALLITEKKIGTFFSQMCEVQGETREVAVGFS
jgi:hypothetical protein